MSRNCMHLVAGTVTYYTVLPVVYASSIVSLAWRVYEIRRGTKRRKYRNTRANTINERQHLDSEHLLQEQLLDMECEKARGWKALPTPEIRCPEIVLPDYEPLIVVESADMLSDNAWYLKPDRFSMLSHHSRIGSMSSALHCYLEASNP